MGVYNTSQHLTVQHSLEGVKENAAVNVKVKEREVEPHKKINEPPKKINQPHK
jgi:hypothetical protein